MIETKRFIAGAVCPKCHQRDKIRLQKLPDKQVMDCIDCGFIACQDFSSYNNQLKKE